MDTREHSGKRQNNSKKCNQLTPTPHQQQQQRRIAIVTLLKFMYPFVVFLLFHSKRHTGVSQHRPPYYAWLACSPRGMPATNTNSQHCIRKAIGVVLSVPFFFLRALLSRHTPGAGENCFVKFVAVRLWSLRKRRNRSDPGFGTEGFVATRAPRLAVWESSDSRGNR